MADHTDEDTSIRDFVNCSNHKYPHKKRPLRIHFFALVLRVMWKVVDEGDADVEKWSVVEGCGERMLWSVDVECFDCCGVLNLIDYFHFC